jgi:lysosomal Pro-X carboxypeptidase
MNGFSYMAMTNYPYPTSFLTPKPAWPVNVACDYFQGFPSMEDPTATSDDDRVRTGGLTPDEAKTFAAMLKAVNVYFNNNSTSPNCTDFDDTDATGDLDGFGWNVLACNQLAMPCANGPNSMFIEGAFDYNAFTDYCVSTYKMTPRYDWVWRYLGGNDTQRDFKSISNIIFSNGELDPWRAGGLNEKIVGNDKIDVLFIARAAHHLDLREPNEQDDPQEVKDARAQELKIMQGWIKEYMSQ